MPLPDFSACAGGGWTLMTNLLAWRIADAGLIELELLVTPKVVVESVPLLGDQVQRLLRRELVRSWPAASRVSRIFQNASRAGDTQVRLVNRVAEEVLAVAGDVQLQRSPRS